jgi:hypothetical protein
MPAIGVHHTDTTDSAWDAGENEKRLRSGEDEQYYSRMYAWRDPEADPTTKTAYKFPHHEVDGDGNPGAANLTACSAGIAVLNGGRGGADIPDSDREGVYRHLAAHLRDGGKEPPELMAASAQKSAPERLQLRALAPSTIDVDRRTVEVVAYSGSPVMRVDVWTGESYQLRLGLEPAQVRMGRLVGAPVLDSHSDVSIENQIGVVEDARIERGQLIAKLRFSSRADVEPIWQDIRDGIIRNVSIGALIYKREKQDDGSFLATDWEPMEISVVPVPADPRATVLSMTRVDSRNPKEEVMTEQVTAAGNETRDSVDLSALRAQIAAEQRKIRAAVRGAGLDERFADELCSAGLTLDEARSRIVDELAARYEQAPTRSQVVTLEYDEVDKRIAGMTEALMHQVAPGRYQADGKNPWRGMRLSRLAEECVRLSGRGRPTTPNELVKFALSTSDFPNVLANVATKTLLDAYQYAAPTYKRWAKQSTAPDFKPVSRVRIGEFPQFNQLAEGGTITYGSVAESKEQYAIATYARGVVITREMIINDDLGAIQQLFTGIGVQAAALENKTVYTVLTSNPIMSDGQPLFVSVHGNVASSGGAISIATLDAGTAAMMTQKGLDGVTPLNIPPRFLIVPVAKRVTAIQFTNVPNIVVTKQTDFNPFAGQLEVVADANLDAASTTAWYLAADPLAVPTVEYAYLEGAQGPQVERVDNPDDLLGLKVKAWLDFGAKAIDWRGLYKNPGA